MTMCLFHMSYIQWCSGAGTHRDALPVNIFGAGTAFQ